MVKSLGTSRDRTPQLEAGRAGSPLRIYKQLAVQIAETIRAGEFKVGSRLPAERDLAERYEVSRASVREAIIALEVIGMVEVRGGSGIYVISTQESSEIQEETPGPFELLHARRMIEAEVAGLAAESAKPADLDAIYTALKTLEDPSKDHEATERADRDFHVAIALATGNSALVQVVSMLWDQGRGRLWWQMDSHFHTEALDTDIHEDHHLIFKAIVNRDSTSARRAMATHIDRVLGVFAHDWGRQRVKS